MSASEIDEAVKAAWRAACGPLVGASDGQTYEVPSLSQPVMRQIVQAVLAYEAAKPAAASDVHAPWFAQFGALHREDMRGFVFTVSPPEFAEDVAAGLNALDALSPERETVKALREALTECIATLALVERPAFIDPHHGVVVDRLGARIGYGALMSSASASWRAKLERDGLAGGEFVCGPCHATVVSTLAKARAALTQEGE